MSLSDQLMIAVTSYHGFSEYISKHFVAEIIRAVAELFSVSPVQMIETEAVPSGLSFLAASYKKTLLMDHYFKYAVINGSVPISDPMETIREASRITAEDGRILFFCDDQFLLEDTFRMMFPSHKEWNYDQNIVIAAAENKDFIGNTHRK